MAHVIPIAGPECAEEDSLATTARQRELVSEMLLRLSDALAEGAPLFAQQRMLSDLSVYAHLVVRSHHSGSARDAEFLHRLARLESGLTRQQHGLDPTHLDEIRGWFDAQFAAASS